ncbi:MAG: eukaryotic-like serine/threonine-protein kinase [Candidatus Sumerlaeota bacterium]|nr:eukaryotic-like serine/threonine-protein kinase [Candidatus Sumerlaeota bacterium]
MTTPPGPKRHPAVTKANPGGSASDRLAAVFAQRNYELLGELGRGGMGVVYLARDTKLGRKVALKTLSPDRATRDNSLARFEREARTFAQIRHPHIATLYEFADDGPIQFLALEYIDGYDLESERRRGKKWDPREAARVVQTVAGALQYTHSKGILHRDIKPGNILIERGTDRVVLTDFGLAKGQKDETLTASGFAVGTPAYMAPEQITDQFKVQPDGRADVFSLGTVCYEMLTGEHPFIGPDDLKTMRNIVQKAPKPLREIEPGIPEVVEQVVLGMLAKHPKDRIGDAGVVADLLDRWLNGKKLPDSLAAFDPAQAPPQEAKAPAAKPAAASAPASTPAQAPVPAAPSSMKTTIMVAILVGVAMLSIGIIIGLLVLGGK